MAARRPAVLGMRHVALRVRDLERMLPFYGQVLGMAVEWRPDQKNVYLTSGGDNLALHEVEAPAVGSGGFQALDHIGFVVARPRDVDAFARYLAHSGVAVERPPRTHRDGARSLYVRDPEGNLVQIIYHPPLARAARGRPPRRR